MPAADQTDTHIKQLETKNQELRAQIAWLEHQVDSLPQAVLHAQKQRFGPASEKCP